MKTVILSLAILFTGIFSAQAAPTFDGKGSEKQTIRKLFGKVLRMPDSKKEMVEGAVFVQFEIDTNGTLQVKRIEATDPSLANFVYDKLDGSAIADDYQGENKTYNYRITFRKDQ